MRVHIFNRTKYIKSMNNLKARNAPDYVIEAYEEGHAKVVNEYYRSKILALRQKEVVKESVKKEELKKLKPLVDELNVTFINEALSKKDLDFLKAFFKMTNMDIMTGDKLPPDAAKLIKQGIVKDLGLKELFKKLR